MEMAEQKLLDPIRDMIDRLNVNTVFGEPFTEGDTTVIPVASVMVGFGYGYGEGPAGGGDDSGAAASDEGTPATGAPASSGAGGAGGGGGGGGRATPQGYLRITPSGVTYEPIMDQGRIAMAGILMSAWSVFWISKAIRSLAGR